MEHFHDITLHHYVVCVVVVWPAGPREHVLPLQEDPRGAEAVWELEDGLDVLHWGGGALEVQVDQSLSRHHHWPPLAGPGGGGGGLRLLLISPCQLETRLLRPGSQCTLGQQTDIISHCSFQMLLANTEHFFKIFILLKCNNEQLFHMTVWPLYWPSVHCENS